MTRIRMASTITTGGDWLQAQTLGYLVQTTVEGAEPK